MVYNNYLFTVTDISTPDPCVVQAHGKYYLVFTSGDRVEIWSSNDISSFKHKAQKTVIWRPPPHAPYSAHLWAPELHDLHGRWYIYVACADPKYGNKSHRMNVLIGPPSTQDPTTGPWQHHGPIDGLPAHQWSIDGTVIELQRQHYFVYSGWPLYDRNHNSSNSELIQELFIVQLDSPTSTSTPVPVRISRPQYAWEFSADHGINEGPQDLRAPDGSWVGIAYSCAGSWTADYKVNTLRWTGGDPLDHRNWLKGRTPLLQRRRKGGGPFGPGHGTFVNVDNETMHVFHATDRETDGWEGRKARMQRVMWTKRGPYMGNEVGSEVLDFKRFLEAPLGNGPQKPLGFRELLHVAADKLRNC